MDREKVIRAVESCFDYWLVQHRCLHPLELENVQELKADTLALLKEQEAVRITTDYVDGFGNPIANCPSCKSRLFWSSNKHYCGECGQPVLWEGR